MAQEEKKKYSFDQSQIPFAIRGISSSSYCAGTGYLHCDCMHASYGQQVEKKKNKTIRVAKED